MTLDVFVYTTLRQAFSEAQRVAKSLNGGRQVSAVLQDWPGAKIVGSRLVHLGTIDNSRKQVDVLVRRQAARWEPEIA